MRTGTRRRYSHKHTHTHTYSIYIFTQSLLLPSCLPHPPPGPFTQLERGLLRCELFWLPFSPLAFAQIKLRRHGHVATACAPFHPPPLPLCPALIPYSFATMASPQSHPHLDSRTRSLPRPAPKDKQLESNFLWLCLSAQWHQNVLKG